MNNNEPYWDSYIEQPQIKNNDFDPMNQDDFGKKKSKRKPLLYTVIVIIILGVVCSVWAWQNSQQEKPVTVQSHAQSMDQVQSEVQPTPSTQSTQSTDVPYSYKPEVDSNPEYGYPARDAIEMVSIAYFQDRTVTTWSDVGARMATVSSNGLITLFTTMPEMQRIGVADYDEQIIDIEYLPTKEGDSSNIALWEGSINVKLRPQTDSWDESQIRIVPVKVAAQMGNSHWEVTYWEVTQ